MSSWVVVGATDLPSPPPSTPPLLDYDQAPSLATSSPFHPYLSALKLTKQLRSMSIASSRPQHRPKAKGHGQQRKHQHHHHQRHHHDHLAYQTQHSSPHLRQTHHLVSATTTTTFSYSPSPPRFAPSPSPSSSPPCMPYGDGSDDTIPTSDLTDAYDDADESHQSFTDPDPHSHPQLHPRLHSTSPHSSPLSHTHLHPHTEPHLAHLQQHQHSNIAPSAPTTPTPNPNPSAHHRTDPDAGADAMVSHRVTSHRDSVAHDVTDDPSPSKHERRTNNNRNRQSASGIYSMNDEELMALFHFTKRIGNGNWGQVFEAVPLDSDCGIGADSAIRSGLAGGGRVAIKMVERATNPAATHCIRALWGEMKIIRGLRHEQHPSVIHFEAFLITPSYAAVVMPLHRGPMPLPLPLATALRYFRQLSSAVAYLHERGITHNDIKPANVVISYSDVPILVDFGFAQHHKADDAKRFLSTASWGTPEYLDPLRVMAQPHDERKSDVWSLGVTMYEALVGRTPFEVTADEVFETQDELDEYLRRSRSGKWYGEYHIGDQYLERILQHMLYPDPAYRPPAVEIYTAVSNIISQYDTTSIATPSFARDDSFDLELAVTERSTQRLERARAAERDRERRLKPSQSEVLRRSALGDRKKTASAGVLRPAKQLRTRAADENVFVDDKGKGKHPDVPRPPTKLRPRSRDELKTPRTVRGEARGLRPASSAGVFKPYGTPSPPTKREQTREEALAATLRNLQANSRQGSPAADSPITPRRERERPSSAAADFAREYRERDRPRAAESPRRNFDGSPRRVESLRERSASRRTKLSEVAEVEVLTSQSNTRSTTPKIQLSPARSAPRLDVDISSSSFSPFRPTEPLVSKYRGPPTAPSPNRKAKQSTAPSELAPANDALHDLERLAEWAKRVENYVEQAKRAVAEGRPMPTMSLPDLEALASPPQLSQAVMPQAPPVPEPQESEPPSTEPMKRDSRIEPHSRDNSARELGVHPALHVPMSSMSSRSTASITLQTPRTAAATLPPQKEQRSSLSKAASHTLRRHPVSQVFRRWGGGSGERVMSPEPPRIAARKSEPQLDRRPIPSFGQAEEMLDPEDEERYTASRMGKHASSISLRDTVKASLGMDRNKTVPRRFGASPYLDGRESKESTKKEDKKERRLSLFKLFKGKHSK